MIKSQSELPQPQQDNKSLARYGYITQSKKALYIGWVDKNEVIRYIPETCQEGIDRYF